MANKGGIVTRKDMFSDDAMEFGKEYAKQLNVAIDANKILVDSVKELNKQVQNFKVANNQKDYMTAKQAEALATQQAIDAIKKQEVAEISANKIKISAIATIEAERKAKQAATDAENKLQKTKQASVKLTMDEKVANEANNKILKYEARERLGLVSAYEKLNKARLDSQKRLADLLSAEVRNNAEIVKAQHEFDKLDTRVKAVDAAIKNYSKNIGNYSSAFEGLNGTFRNLIATFGLVTGIELFGVVVKDVFSIIRDFDRQLIAVGKTTNITGDDLKQFGREVVELGDKLDGITVDGLIQSAEVAGQLGVTGTSNILKFSEAIEKLKLTSNIISDEQVGQFAKFIEVSSDSFDNADRLASVITQLGNSFATTEAEVLANATEIQKGIAVYNTSAQGVLALGAATSTLGSEAESSRSAIQSTFSVINNAIATGANLEKVLKLTGLTQKELSKQFNQDATGVFQKFIKGLSDAKKGGQNLALVLNDVEITEKRAFTVIGSLAANYGILESSIAQANKEYIDNAALNKEVAAASESIDSIVGDLVDRWQAYVLQTNDANNGTEALTKTLKFLRDNFKDIINYVIKGGAVLLTYLGIIKLVNFATVTGTAIQTAWTAGQIRFALATGIGTQSILAQAAAARAAMVAQEGLNVAVKATPWGLILGFLSAAVVAYMVFNDEMSQAEKNIQNIVDANKKLQESEKTYAGERDKSNAERFKSIEDDIKLRRAQGENSDKLDKEEIQRKKVLLQASIDAYTQIQSDDLQRTQTEISNSRQRIAQMEIERKDLQKSGYRVNKQGRTDEELTDKISDEKTKLNAKKALLTETNRLTVEERNRLSKQLNDLDKDAAVKDAEFKIGEDKKAKAAREKAAKEALDRAKKLSDSLYELKKQQLERAIKINEDVAKDEEQTDEVRIAALEVSQKKQIALAELTKQHSLDADKFVLAENKLNANQKAFIANEAANKIIDINKKTSDEIDKINEFDSAAYQANLEEGVKKQEIAMNAELATENERFAALGNLEAMAQSDREGAIEEHERRIFDIKKEFAIATAKLQADNLQAELDAFKSQSDGSDKSNKIILDIEKRLSDARLKLTELGLDNFKEKETEKTKSAKEQAEEILKVSSDMVGALADLSNAFSQAKIQKIDDEIAKNDEYYAKQIELAGNDQRQKDLLQKEQEKKRTELEKKKKDAQNKQAKVDKAVAIAQATISTALAVMKGFSESGYVGAILAGVLGAISIATIIATPIPKYKDGRKGGKKEVAMINDGVKNGSYVPEVVERKGGGVEMFSGMNRIVQLYEGDTVHSSVDDYYKLQRAAMMSSIDIQGRKMSDFQATQHFDNAYGKEMLEELKKNTAAVKNSKSNIHFHTPKIDIQHAIWASNNKNWNN
jgi:hypothetical protein